MIGVSLLVHDRLEWIERLHEDLLASDFAAYHHVRVAVDNGSTESVTRFLRDHGWIVLRNPTNVGIVAARNQSFWRLAAEGVDLILELHSDMRLPVFWFTPLLSAMDDPLTWQACSRIVTSQDASLDLTTASMEEIETLCRAKYRCEIPDSIYTRVVNHPCLHRMAPFRDRGFYDDNLLWQGFEDIDWYLEIQRAGKRTTIVRDSIVYHRQGGQRFGLTPDRMTHNEAYVREKWQLAPGWHERLYSEQRDDAIVLLSDRSLCRGTLEGHFAMALVKRGIPLIFVQTEPLRTRFAAPNLQVIDISMLFGGLHDYLVTRGYRGGRAFLLGESQTLVDHWLDLPACWRKELRLRAFTAADRVRQADRVYRFDLDVPSATVGSHTSLGGGMLCDWLDEERLIATQESWEEVARRYLEGVWATKTPR